MPWQSRVALLAAADGAVENKFCYIYMLLQIGVTLAQLWWAEDCRAAPADPQINAAGALKL